MKKKLYLRNNTLAAALFVAAALTVGSCADNDLENRNSEGDKGAAVHFDVKDVQEAVLADANTGTTPTGSRAGDAASYHNQLRELGLTSADLEPQVLEAQSPAGMEACLVESTIPGINPVQPDAQTRATVTKTLTADFSTLGYRATSPTAVSSTPDWFYNARTKSNGELYDKLYWNWDSNHFGRFYAVFPEVKTAYSKIKLSPNTHGGNPYVEFEADPDVANQKDLMTACSGVVEYQTRGVAPNTSLAFRHALTAVHFTVGQNLWAGQIDKIEISGAINKGTYTLSSDPTQPGTWALGTTTGTFTLSGININTAKNPGSVITDDNGNYTFFMIPQEVTGKNIYVDIHFQDGKTIHVPLKGKWLPGTTKTYTLSNKQSNWGYEFEVLGQNNTAAYNVTSAGTYTVRSYRHATGSPNIPIAWKVVGYQVSNDGGNTWETETTTKPDWLDNLSMTEGTGGTLAQQGNVTLKTEGLNLLDTRNAALRENPRGTAGNYYDLSLHDVKGNSSVRNTANCYVISHPGFYKIPLVYGNAITGGVTNDHAYTYKGAPVSTLAPAVRPYILEVCRDHNDQNITDPWIEKTNGGANSGVDGAKVVWADAANLVHLSSSPIVRDAAGDAYLQFEVKAEDIQNANAVVAVTKGGTVVWSWHLWFAPEDVLDVIECTNFQGVKYKFTKETLGFRYTTWTGTTYKKPRMVKVKIEQTSGNSPKKTGYVTITQNPGAGTKQFNATLYQFGRKDALPGTDVLAPGSSYRAWNRGDMSIPYGIKNPDIAPVYDPSWHNAPPQGYSYYNVWSMDNTVVGFNDNPVVKTIYDPCPAGYHIPASNAFTGFTMTGQNVLYTPRTTLAGINTSEPWDYGLHFNNKITNPDATIYFPGTSGRYKGGVISGIGSGGGWYGATPGATQQASYMNFGHNQAYDWIVIWPQYTGGLSSCSAIRPVAEQ